MGKSSFASNRPLNNLKSEDFRLVRALRYVPGSGPVSPSGSGWALPKGDVRLCGKSVADFTDWNKLPKSHAVRGE
jgi:hypothetical protein